MRRAIYLLLPIIFLGNRGLATGDSIHYLTAKDTIFLSIDPFGQKIFEHRLAPKQTVFSMAKFYGLSLPELYLYNPELEQRDPSVGEGVRVPIPNRAIKRYFNEATENGAYVPVYYVVKKGDTMYRISKHYFKMPADTIRQRNRLFSDDLRTGQLLHVGWMNVRGIPESYRNGSGGPFSERNRELERLFHGQRQELRTAEGQGVAYWHRDSKDNLDLFALHRKAKINSIIEVTNPMTRRKVYAKVIGRIPAAAYGDNVVVVLSPLAAKLLGAVDPRFFVRLHYLY